MRIYAFVFVGRISAIIAAYKTGRSRCVRVQFSRSSMKVTVTILWLVIVAGTAMAFASQRSMNANQDLLSKQKLIFELLQHPHQMNLQPQLLTLARGYSIEDNLALYSDVDAVNHFVLLYKKGLIGLDELFSVYNMEHLEQVKSLFELLYYTNTWDGFYKSLVWARFNVNEGQFIYALTMALIHKPDLQGLMLPPIYELRPQLFFGSDVIERGQSLLHQGLRDMKKIEDVYNIIILANYTGAEMHVNDEQRMSYFTEDIGLNAFHYYFHMDYPFWMGGAEFGLKKDRRGELYLFMNQQLLARYYLERLSNDLGHIKELAYWMPIPSGYYPNLRSYQGYPFVPRENNYLMYEEGVYSDIDMLYNIEMRIMDAIDSGKLINETLVDILPPESIEIIGNIVQGNPDAVNLRYYGLMEAFMKLFGKTFAKGHKKVETLYPEVIAHPETQLRDPLYWMIMKRQNLFLMRFKEKLLPYLRSELLFDGVKIESVVMDKLITYFDLFDADITNAVDVELPLEENASRLRQFGRISNYRGEDILVKARQYRLNNVPFKLNLAVSSLEALPSIVRIYLGPKYDDGGHLIGLNENRMNYVLLDIFKYDLVAGNNMIVRDSRSFLQTVRDKTTYFELYKYVMGALSGEEPFLLDNKEAHSGFPNRLVLPKGKVGGQLYSLFVYISPYVPSPVEQYSGFESDISVGIGSGARWLSSMPFGYPLDRKINELNWHTPNMLYLDVPIFHKTENEINRT